VEKIKHLVKWPLLYPETYTRLGVKPPSGLILYGPSGNFNFLLRLYIYIYNFIKY